MARHSPRYDLRYADEYLQDLRELPRSYDLPLITKAVAALAYQAEMTTRNRRGLITQISWCPAATRQQKVGGYRILYRVDDGVVSVLRVRFKGSRTTEEMGP